VWLACLCHFSFLVVSKSKFVFGTFFHNCTPTVTNIASYLVSNHVYENPNAGFKHALSKSAGIPNGYSCSCPSGLSNVPLTGLFVRNQIATYKRLTLHLRVLFLAHVEWSRGRRWWCRIRRSHCHWAKEGILSSPNCNLGFCQSVSVDYASSQPVLHDVALQWRCGEGLLCGWMNVHVFQRQNTEKLTRFI